MRPHHEPSNLRPGGGLATVMTRLRCLDLFCGGGGATRGYQMAGFHVTGVDINPQPNYCGDVFIQADAMTFPLEGFDLIHASPPCQAYSITQLIHGREYPELVAPVRERLEASGTPYIIENVVGAPLLNAITLCGTHFGLRVYRHRLFESNCLLLAPSIHPRHDWRCTQVGRKPKDGEYLTIAGHFSGITEARAAMGISWMTRDELSQAIPPAYTRFLAEQIVASLVPA